MMVGFEYGNTRLRAMKSRLLSRKELEVLANSGTLPGLIAGLTKTAYRRPVEAALARVAGMACIDEAVRLDLRRTLGKIGDFYGGHHRSLVSIILRPYEVHNLKAIFRGLSRGIPAGEIIPALLPIGDLPSAILIELATATELRAVIDLLASMRLPIAQPLLKLRVERPGARSAQFELALEKWHFDQARKDLRSVSSSLAGPLTEALALDADINNLLTIMRFAHLPAERPPEEQLAEYFLGPGRLSHRLLTRAGREQTIPLAIGALSGTRYEAPLRAGYQDFVLTGRLSDIEKQLMRFRLQWMAGLVLKDPLGIGVVLGYVALKVNEVGNIRKLAEGIVLGVTPHEILEDLEMVL